MNPKLDHLLHLLAESSLALGDHTRRYCAAEARMKADRWRNRAEDS